jgi:hypothetical protein
VYFAHTGALFELVLLYWMLVFAPYTAVGVFFFFALCVYIFGLPFGILIALFHSFNP